MIEDPMYTLFCKCERVFECLGCSCTIQTRSCLTIVLTCLENHL